MQVGDIVYIEKFNCFNKADQLESRRIVKVGRKWIYLDGPGDYRFSPDEMMIDSGGYASRWRVWYSRESYERKKATNDAWMALKNAIRDVRQPPDLTVEKIEEARRILGI